MFQDIELVDSPGGSTVMGEVLAGEKVQAITGGVHTVPLEFILGKNFRPSENYDL